MTDYLNELKEILNMLDTVVSLEKKAQREGFYARPLLLEIFSILSKKAEILIKKIMENKEKK